MNNTYQYEEAHAVRRVDLNKLDAGDVLISHPKPPTTEPNGAPFSLIVLATDENHLVVIASTDGDPGCLGWVYDLDHDAVTGRAWEFYHGTVTIHAQP